jgi:hypothetical protein
MIYLSKLYLYIIIVKIIIIYSRALLLVLGSFFQFLNLIQSQYDSLHGGSARRNRNREQTHTDIHASSGIRSVLAIIVFSGI